MPRRSFLPTLLLLAAATRAFAWDAIGHMAIGTLAESLLHERARRQVKTILGTDDLAGVSVWLDQLRSADHGTGPLAGNVEAATFNKKIPRTTSDTSST